MATKQKTLAAATLLAALSSTIAFGDVNETTPDSSNGWVSAISAEAFYGAGLEKLYKGDLVDEEGDLDELDIGGISVRYTVRKQTTDAVSPEFFGIVSLGGGSLDQTWYYLDGDVERNYDLFTMQTAVGANIRVQPSDKFSIFAGARVGFSIESLGVEWKDNGITYYDKTESAVGFLYGAGIGAQFNFNEHNGMTVGVDYVGSTAEPEFDVYGYTVKAEAQSYVLFSIGYKFTF